MTVRVPPKPSRMNKLEAAYALVLEARKRAGEIRDYWYEGMTFKLAHDTRYTPDFVVQFTDDTMEIHETKGFFRDDAKVKVKVCAQMYPFPIKLVRRHGQGWTVTEVAA